MPRSDRLAFLTMALYGCGFLVSFELMLSRPEPFTGLTAAALVHLACVVAASVAVPWLAGGGATGRMLLCALFLLSFAVRLAGMGGWLNDWTVRAGVQAGQGLLAAGAFWLFFSLTPRPWWPTRFVLAWLAGFAGKELILLACGNTPTALYAGVGLVFAVLAATASACVLLGSSSTPGNYPTSARTSARPLVVLAGNAVLIAVLLGLLTGWIGSFHVMWTDAVTVAPRVVVPAALMLAGWSLRRDFRGGFLRLAGLCAVLCLAIAGMAVLQRETVQVRSIPFLAVGCHTLLFVCMTLAMARAAASPRVLGPATVTPYAAILVCGLVAHAKTPLWEAHFSLMVGVCLAAFLLFYLSIGSLDFADPPPLRQALRLDELYERYDLSARERQVANFLARGHATASIAKALYLSRHTVNSHVRNMCGKTGLSGRDELAEVLRCCSEFGPDGNSDE